MRRLPLHDLSTHFLHHVAEVHARRASRLACPAIEATEHVFHERRSYVRATFVKRPHQINAPAWRVHLAAQNTIRGTRGQAEPTMDAVEVQRSFLRILCLFVAHFCSPSTWRPGFNRPSGSYASFILFINSYSARFNPNVGILRRTSSGAFSITARYFCRMRTSSSGPSICINTIPFSAWAIHVAGRYSFIISCTTVGSPTTLTIRGPNALYALRSRSHAPTSSEPSTTFQSAAFGRFLSCQSTARGSSPNLSHTSFAGPTHSNATGANAVLRTAARMSAAAFESEK